MATLFDDPFLDLPAESGILQAPGPSAPGIGLAQEQAPAPVFESVRLPPLARPPARRDLIREELGGLPTTQRIGLGLQSFAAGVAGRPSPIDALMKRRQEERLVRTQELTAHVNALGDGMKMVRNLTGEARAGFIEQYSSQLEELSPSLGEAFRTLSKQPDFSASLMKYAAKSPTLMRAVEVGGVEAATKLLQSPEAAKTIQAEIDSSVMPLLLRKGQTFLMGWQQLVPPEMAARFNRDQKLTATELLEANEWIRVNKPELKALVLSEEELQIVARNSDAFYASIGILSPKEEAHVRVKKIEEKETAPTTRTREAGLIHIVEEFKEGKWIEISRAPRFKPDTASDKLRDQVREEVAKIQLKIKNGEPVTAQERAFVDEVNKSDPMDIIRRTLLAPSATPTPQVGASPRPGQPAGGKIKRHKIGDIVDRAGKKWKVTGFASDGEPLVEEVKRR